MDIQDLIDKLEELKQRHGEHSEVFMVNGSDNEFSPRRVEDVTFETICWESDGEHVPHDCIKLIPDY